MRGARDRVTSSFWDVTGPRCNGLCHDSDLPQRHRYVGQNMQMSWYEIISHEILIPTAALITVTIRVAVAMLVVTYPIV